MDAQMKRGLMEACVLSLLLKGDSYGYLLIQEVSALMPISESTLYPVLRRLQKDTCLETYDREFGGRNRRYYKLTEIGRAKLKWYELEWRQYSEKVTGLFEGGIVHE